MTTIAIKDGIMAVDSSVTQDGIRVGRAIKCTTHPDGGYIAGAGSLGDFWKLVAAIGADEGFPQSQGNNFVWLKPDGAVLVADDSGLWFAVEADFYAEGSGFQIAMGAMAAGASAEEAVRIACRYDTGSSEPVHIFDRRDERLKELAEDPGANTIERMQAKADTP